MFIAATNINKIVPDYLKTGIYEPKPSVATISNAMDVGAPSNFARMMWLYDNDHGAIKADISGYHFDDDQTRQAIRQVHETTGYLPDPHGAVGYLGLKAGLKNYPNATGIFLETAHPAKFLDVVEDATGKAVPIPDRLQACMQKDVISTPIPADVAALKSWLLSR